MEQQDYSDAACPKDWQRFYLGYRERFVDDCCIPLANGKVVRLKQAPSAKQLKQHAPHSKPQKQHKPKQQQPPQQLDKQSDPALTGSTVWDGAVVLAQYLANNASMLHERRKQHNSSSSSPDSHSTCDAVPGSNSSSNDNKNCNDNCPRSTEQQHPQLSLLGGSCCQQQQQLHQPQHKQQQQGQSRDPSAALPDSSSSQEPSQVVQDPITNIADSSSSSPHGFTCLELGAGTGAVSLCLLAAGAVDYAVVTDIPDMLPHLQSNVVHNSRALDTSRALVLPLRWGEADDVAALARHGQQQQQQQQHQQQQQQHQQQQMVLQRCGRLPVQLQPPFELIVGSDLIYYSYTPATPHSKLLLQALVQLAGPDSMIYLALSLHHNPEEVHAFLKWAETDWGFEVQHVTEGIPEEYVVPDVLVVQLRLVDQHQAVTTLAAAAAGALRREDEDYDS